MQRYIVGGYCRDKLLGLKPHDKDFVVVGATEEELKKHGYKKVGGKFSFPVFLDPDSNQVAMARREKKTGDGHTGFQFEFTPDVSLEEDLKRRDFTVNTLVMDENENIVKTSFTDQALEDLKTKTLRMMSKKHFAEDPLRALRAIRFVSMRGFKFDPKTEKECRKIFTTEDYARLPIERKIDEIERCFNANCGAKCVELMHQMGALEDFDFKLDEMFEVKELPENHPEGTTGGHVLSCLKFLDAYFSLFHHKKQAAVYWAVLYHDIGKVYTNEDTGHFYTHDVAGSKYIKTYQCFQIKNTETRSLIEVVAEQHMRFSRWNQMKPGKRVDLVSKELRGHILGFIIACVADWYGRSDITLDEIKLGFIRKMICYLAYQMMFIQDIVKGTKFQSKEECNRVKPEKRSAILRDKAISNYVGLTKSGYYSESLTKELLDAKLRFLQRVGALGTGSVRTMQDYCGWLNEITRNMGVLFNYWNETVDGKGLK